MERFNHLSVMADEVVDNLITDRSGVYVDCTLGGGGHSLKISQQLNDNALIIGIDQDIEAINAAKIRLNDVKCQVKIIHNNFSQINEILDECNIDKVDGILFDLGVSSHQIDTAERGFSYMQNAPLDMRMDTSKNFTAYNVVNEYAEENLYKIFHEYGEERFSKRIAKKIVETRKIKKIVTTQELVNIVFEATPRIKSNIHPATRIFQAIRIEVNQELNNIKNTLNEVLSLLSCGAIISVVTFHSLEDRIVKNYFRNLGKQCVCPPEFASCKCGGTPCAELLTRKPVEPTAEEVKINSPSRSAKLRVVRKLRDANEMRLYGVEAM